jgi:hypothetical protein
MPATFATWLKNGLLLAAALGLMWGCKGCHRA